MLLITGSNGQLGAELKRMYTTSNAIFTDRQELDVTANILEIESFCEKNNIAGIINCSAYTSVDKAEEAKELCHKVNMIGVENLARISAIRKIPLIHISTDYVFDGTNNIPYKEDDITNPQSVYGKSKLEAEKAFMDLAYSGVIIRTSWLYSSFGNNFVKTIIRLGNDRNNLNVIFDQIGTPTYAYDLAEAIFKILPQIKDGEKDIYHFSNEGVASWYDLAWEIVEMKNINCKVIPIETKDYLLPAARPQYSVLNKEKIKERFNININHWKEGLKKCLKKIY